MVGVGGQGTILASDILGEAALAMGLDVKKTDTLGMAQRGGSVVSHVRFGARVYSPIIPEGEADFLLGYELLETYRYLPLLKNSGKVVVNNLKINPPSVSTGQQDYPEGIAEKIKATCPASALVDGLALAKQAGSVKTANTVLIGALSRLTGVDEHYWLTAIERMVPGKTLEMNKKAFELGRGCAV